MFSPLQTSKPTTANASPTARGLRMVLGSGGAMSWWRRWPTHGGKGPKPLEGRAAAAHVGCCALCVVFCVVASKSNISYIFDIRWLKK